MSSPLTCPVCRGPVSPADTACPVCQTVLDRGSVPLPSTPAPLPAVEGYEILGVLGEGAMGVVFRARQSGLERLVALKMIRPGGHLAPSLRDRFLAEARAVARLRHPNIVQIFEVADRGGLPFFSMEYVEGGTLSGHLQRRPQDPTTAARLVRTLAQAVQHAHEQGIVHRDLKPANVLLDAGQPKVSDFGLAKLLGSDGGATQSGAVVGTPSYMAPEQARGEGRAVGPAADVWALGVILYEALTGRLPFVGKDTVEILMNVCGAEPVLPSRLEARVPRDLEIICLKCLHKEPQRRYASAAHLADDLGRFLDGVPIVARPVGRAERARLWCKRNRAVASLLGALALALVVGLAGVLWQWGEVVAERDEKERQRGRAAGLAEDEKRERVRAQKAEEEKGRAFDSEQGARYLQNVALADHEWYSDNPLRAAELLADCPERLRRWEWHYLKRLVGRQGVELRGHGAPVKQLAFSSRGVIASGSEDTTVRLWEPLAHKLLFILRGHKAKITGLAFDPEGKTLASCDLAGAIWLWDVATGKELGSPLRHGATAAALAFSPDGTRLFTGGSSAGQEGSVRVWNVAERSEVKELSGLKGAIYALAVSPNGMWLAGCDLANTVHTWDAKTFAARRSFTPKVYGRGSNLRFAPDGRRLLWADSLGQVYVWAPFEAAALPPLLLTRHPAHVDAIDLTADGSVLATGGHDRAVRLWEWKKLLAQAGKGAVPDVQETYLARNAVLRGHPHSVLSLAFAPRFREDGKLFNGLLATGGPDGVVRLWEPFEPATFDGLRDVPVQHVLALDVSGDSRLLAYGGILTRSGSEFTGQAGVIDLAAGDIAAATNMPGQVTAVALRPGAKELALANDRAEVRLFDLTTRKTREIAGHGRTVRGLAWSRDGRWLATAAGQGITESVAWGKAGEVFLWDADDWGKPPLKTAGHPEGGMCVAFSPDGKLFASGGMDGRVRFWDVPGGNEVGSVVTSAAGTAATFTLAFRRDGKELATAGSEGTLTVWDLSGGAAKARKRLSWVVSSAHVQALAYSPDGTRILTSGFSPDPLVPQVRLWDAQTGRPLLTFRHVERLRYAAAFSPDGRKLYLGGFGPQKLHEFDGSPAP